ncbi:hypothetical protein JW979_14940 [bacterium]|nr:hypothetical protein [candidate division CSSED10-310 bacterium]
MKRQLLLVMLVLSTFLLTSPSFAQENVKSSEWIDVTDQILANPANEDGWLTDEEGKIFRDKEGLNLKITTTKFGVFIVNLKEGTVAKIDSDNTQKTLDDVKLFQRDHGFSIVFRNPEFKIRCKLNEKVDGMKHIPGIKAL